MKLSREGTASAPLLYWLLIVCGLTGITVMRIDSVYEVTPIWIGTLLGVGLAQLLVWQRIRSWIPAILGICGLWFAPVLYFVLVDAFGNAAEVGAMAFVPAAICGYLASTTRGALVAFWYPAVLWMLVILDGPAATAVDLRAGAPFAIGLTALFIGFLRARETRRVSLWKKHSNEPLAKPIGTTTLRASPFRNLSQLGWTALVGVAALVMAAWIAPHLWKMEKDKHAREVALAAGGATPGPATDASGQEPCCWDTTLAEENQVKVREYLPLLNGKKELSPPPVATSCRTCGSATSSYNTKSSRAGEPYPNRFTSNGNGPYTANDPYGYGTGTGGYGAGGAGTAYVAPPQVTATPTQVGPVVTTPDPPKPLAPPATPTTTTAPVAVGAPAAKTTTPTPVATHPSGPVANGPVIASPKSTPPPTRDLGAPWEWTLGLSFLGIGIHLLLRVFRRSLTLRHLTRPFWAETLDQRISNHWHRMLIGLRDAGIHPGREEQPQAFARRIGIDGMTTCATILERVRHGVRVDDGDLDAMNLAASNVYRAARARAGIGGRLTSWVRSPLV